MEDGAWPQGVRHLPRFLSPIQRAALVEALVGAVVRAPFFVPRMPRTGKAMSVRMTNLGPLGWLTDKAGGYRYQAHHPETGEPWPALPPVLLEAWDTLATYPHPPQACLVNLYEPGARMGMHQDRDEDDLDAPVVSLSLGDTARFRVGGATRGGPTLGIDLADGDALVLEGPSRLAHHGVTKVFAGTGAVPELAPQGGRINLTMRRVTRP